jgi:hypothetical protein
VGAGSEAQPRPADRDRLCLDAVDDDELLTAGGSGHEADIPAGHTELVGEEAEKGLIGGAGDGRSGDTGPEDPVDHAVDMVRPRTRSQTDGEADVGVRQDSAQRC